MGMLGLMAQYQEQDNVVMIRRLLDDQGFAVEETANGVHLKLDSGHLIDIYALLKDSDVFWASVEAKARDAEKRYREMEAVKDTLLKGLAGIAEVGAFKETHSMDDRFVYVANLEINSAVSYHGAILIGDEPAEVRVPEGRVEPPPEHETPVTPAKKKGPAPRSDLEEALEKLESVDAKMLRQGLDMMNLKRSSSVRLSLTRIFRSAGSAEELMRDIKAEAKRLVTPEDHDELEMVRQLSVNGFLESIVALLHREVFRGREKPEVS